MDPIFDLDEIKKSFDSVEVTEDSVKYVYLGSVFHLLPSGKYYVPFACSNLTVCPKCGGTGTVESYKGDDKTCRKCGGTGSEEAYRDEKWFEQAEEELESIGACLEHGEGDPTDLFAVMSVDQESLEECDAG